MLDGGDDAAVPDGHAIDAGRAPAGPLLSLFAIAKALSLEADVLIMDEPTSSLTEQEAQALFRVIRDLKAACAGIVSISHRLDEMREIVDRVTVRRHRLGDRPRRRLHR